MYKAIAAEGEIKICAKWMIVNSQLISGSKSLLLDRDGVIILDHGYVNTMAKTDFINDTIKFMQAATANKIPISIITNQAGVGHGFFSEAHLVEFNLSLLNRMKEEFGIEVNCLLYCPSHPQAKIDGYRKKCSCRKPMTSLIDLALRVSSSNAKNSTFLGDKETDELAAKHANVDFVKFPNNFKLGDSLAWLVDSEKGDDIAL